MDVKKIAYACLDDYNFTLFSERKEIYQLNKEMKVVDILTL
jgi:hypothetical protein